MKHTDIINSLALEQKCALLSGETGFTTRDYPANAVPGPYTHLTLPTSDLT